MGKHTLDNLTQYAIEKNTLSIFANIAIGNTGAPTIAAKKNKGIVSVVRNSAGKYTITLTQAYQYLMFMDACVIVASGAPLSASNISVVVRADNSNASTPTVAIECLNSSGAAADLPNGGVLLIELKLKYGTV